MCVFNRKSSVIVTPRYLMLSTFSRTVPSKSIWSMDLFYPFPSYLHHIAFDRLKSHTPFPCPASQLIYIFLKLQCVLCILNFSVANTVICKESYFRINVYLDIIMYKDNNKGPRTVPCGTPETKSGLEDYRGTTPKKKVPIIRLYWSVEHYCLAKSHNFQGWGYTHDRRADKDSYPHDRNVTDELCSLIKLCFAFIMVNFST